MADCYNKIVIIDTGITFDNKLLSFNSIIDGYRIQKNDIGYNVISIDDDPYCVIDDVGHGTGIAEIIMGHNKHAKLVIIKIFDNSTKFVDEDLLIYTLDFLLNSSINFDLVNLSMGLCCTEDLARLEKICKAYYTQNKCIISAFDNSGAISFPAACEYVIGVTSEDFCFNPNEYYIVRNNQLINVCAKGCSQRVYWKDGQKIWAKGNSYACAHVTGILSNFEKAESIDLLRTNFEKHCSGYYDELKEKSLLENNKISSYKKVAVFPFNKEMHSLIRFSHELSFEIVDVYDFKYSAHVGAMTDTILRQKCHNNYRIRDIDNIDINSFDSFILGHIGEVTNALKSKFKIEELICTLLKAGKNVYSFDNISNFVTDDLCNDLLYFPQKDEQQKYIAPFGKLYCQDKPIIGVFGTSSKQGKFTLQLKIRYNLLKKQYNVCQIGTEPSALLFGMNGVFHNGYNSGKVLNQYDAVAYLNKLVYDNSRNADIVIVGAQSGIVLRDTGNLANYYFKQIDFLFGTLPDIAILCINSFDDIKTIKRAIALLQATIDCDVIAVVMYPFYYNNDDIYHQQYRYMDINIFSNYYKQYFESNLQLPVIYPDSELDIDRLCNMITSSFISERT